MFTSSPPPASHFDGGVANQIKCLLEVDEGHIQVLRTDIGMPQGRATQLMAHDPNPDLLYVVAEPQAPGGEKYD